jgi:hypothetical protein
MPNLQLDTGVANNAAASIAAQLQGWAVPSILLVPAVIAKKLLSVPEVESVSIEQDGAMFHVWTVVDNPAEEIFDRIYDHEKQLIHELDCSLRFDFRVISRRGRTLNSLITIKGPIWYR